MKITGALLRSLLISSLMVLRSWGQSVLPTFAGVHVSQGAATQTITLVNHVGQSWANSGAGGSQPVTTSGITTTTGTLIIMSVGGDFNRNSCTATVSDSKGNTYHPLTRRVTDVTDNCLYYAYDHGGTALVVGAGHTFTVQNFVPNLEVTVWSGTKTDSTVFDLQNGAASTVSSLQPGSITPSVNGCLVITSVSAGSAGADALSIDSGFTKSDHNDLSGGGNLASAQAYKVQTTAAAVNPTWSAGSAVEMAASIASFKPGP